MSHLFGKPEKFRVTPDTLESFNKPGPPKISKSTPSYGNEIRNKNVEKHHNKQSDCETPYPSTNLNERFNSKLNNYMLIRKKIFSENHLSKKVLNARRRYRDRQDLRKAIESTKLDKESDIRPYLTVSLFGKKISGLADTGSEVIALGKNSLQFLKDANVDFTPFNGVVTTADNSKSKIVGKLKGNIIFKGVEKAFTILIVPSLKQQLYLGSNFIKSYDLAPQLFSTEEIESTTDTVPEMHSLTFEQNEALQKIIDKFPSYEKFGLGRTHLLEHTIDTGNSLPVKQRYYPYSPAVQKILEEAVDSMLEEGIIQHSESGWNSPIAPVIKTDKVRICLDARKLNSVTVPFAYPLPIIGGLLSRLSDTVYISSVDLKNAFWQIPLDEESREKTAFTIPGRPLYEFRVMPFGLSNAAQRLCQLMDRVIPSQFRDRIFVYLDDLLIFSSNFEEHLKLLDIVAERLKWANLTINIKKSKFCFKELRYLGYIVGNKMLKADPKKVAAIVDYPIPRSLKQLRSFVGMASYYRRFVKDFSTITTPLTNCMSTMRKFSLTPEAIESFSSIKLALTTAPVLVNPDFSKNFIIACDASTSGVGGVLEQLDEKNEPRPICYYSHKLNKAQKNYSITELECLAAVQSVKFFRPYVEGHSFKIITDHASLQWLMQQRDLTGRLARWAIKLSQFSFTIEHRKGSQHVVPDALSRTHIESLSLSGLANESPIDLNSEAFLSDEYKGLIDIINNNSGSLPDVKVHENLVFKKVKFNRGGSHEENRCWKLWLPSSLTSSVIEYFHCPPSSSHGGLAKTVDKIRSFFFWPHMYRDVKQFVQKCLECKSIKSPNYSTRPEMGRAFVVDRAFQHIYIDFLGPYPRTSKGYSYIFVLVDQLTKFPLIKPMAKATAVNVIQFLTETFTTFGTPESLLSDNGSQFLSNIFKEFLKSYGIRHVKTGYYAPQSNASERLNRTILSSIRAYIDTDHTKWDIHLPEIMSAVRSSIHSAIELSPYQALFGQRMIQHASLYSLLRKLNCISESDFEVINPNDNQQEIREQIKQKLLEAHQRYAKSYNTRSKVRNFSIGQEVMYRNMEISSSSNHKNKKFSRKFIKSRVLSIVGKNLYELGDLCGNSIGVFHGKDIITI